MPTKAELAGAARWCRDKLASWLATTWLYIILWTVVAITFGVLLYIDGKFSRSLAEGVEAIDPLSFQMMGWAYRLFAAAFLMAAARCAYKGIQGKWAFRWLGVFASIIVCLHAFGFGFEALSDRRDQATAKIEVAEVQATGKADLIAALETRKTTIDTDTAKAVETLNAEIYNLDNDGKINEDLTDRMRDRREKLEDKAALDKAALDTEILALMREASNGKVEAVEANATVKPWAPLFVGIAQLATWSKEPSDWAIYLCAIGFVIFWVLLGESLVIFLPERIYLMHLKDAEGRPESPNVSMSQAEYDDLQRAKEVHENIQAGAKKGARTRRQGKKIEAGETYYRERIAEWMLAHNEGIPTVTIANSAGMTVAVMRSTYGPHMTPEEHDALFFVSAPQAAETEAKSERSEPETEAKSSEEPTPDNIPPPELMGGDVSETPEETTDLMGGEVSEIGGEVSEPDDELTIPDEPKEYGIEVWQGQTDEPANEDDDEDLKEAANV
jgi:hemerythrin